MTPDRSPEGVDLDAVERRAKAAADLLAMFGASVPADSLRRDIPAMALALREARAENERLRSLLISLRDSYAGAHFYEDDRHGRRLRVRDHACPLCYPGGEITEATFRCPYHTLIAIVGPSVRS